MNRLLKTTNEGNGASFRYRADGLRVEKVSGLAMVYIQNEEDDSGFYDDNLAVNEPTTRWYYDGQMGMEDDYRTKPNLTLPDQYTVNRCGLGARGIDSISRYYGTPSSFSLQEVSYPVYDGHGNMVLTVRRNGSSFTTHDERRYDVWGSVRAGSGASSQRYCASLGHVLDDESGLIYMRARYYEPGSGRFVSEDPARDGLNWYGYASGRPTDLADFTGNNVIMIGFLIAAFARAITETGKDFRDGGLSIRRIVLKTATGTAYAYMSMWAAKAIVSTMSWAAGVAKVNGIGGAVAFLVAGYTSVLIGLLDIALIGVGEGLVDYVAPDPGQDGGLGW